MIIYNLTCKHNHRFEGWFGSISDFEKQQTDKFITCPFCGNNHIQKLPETSSISSTSTDADAPNEMGAPSDRRLTNQEIFSQLIAYVINQTEDADDAFADEAHKINSQETGIRYIHVATMEEVRDLIEEGVEILPLALKPPGKLH